MFLSRGKAKLLNSNLIRCTFTKFKLVRVISNDRTRTCLEKCADGLIMPELADLFFDKINPTRGL